MDNRIGRSILRYEITPGFISAIVGTIGLGGGGPLPPIAGPLADFNLTRPYGPTAILGDNYSIQIMR